MEQQAKTKRERNIAFDVMNILACFGVVALHHNGLAHSYVAGSAGWVQSFVVECLCYCSVPLFMMISGANLLAYRERYTTAEFFKKRFLRTVVPWLFWSVLFLVWKLGDGQMVLEPLNLRTCVNAILNSKVMSVYWFFPALFVCYLVMPVLSLARNRRKLLWYTAGILFLFYSVKPAAALWLKLNWSIDEPLGGYLLIFTVLGYLLATGEPGKKERAVIYVLGAAGLFFRFFYTWYWSVQLGATDVSIKGYSWFHSVFYACAVFVLGCRIPWRKILPQWLQKRIPDISACSFGVFLIHRMLMQYESEWLGIGNNDLIWRTLCVPLTYLVCLGIVSLIRRIPGVRIIVGG